MDRRSFIGALTASLVIGCTPSGEPLVTNVAVELAVMVSEQASVHAADGAYLVIDRARHEVVRMSNDGQVLHRLGGLGLEVGKFNGPSQVAFAPNGDAWILDRGNRRLQRFDANGRSVSVVPIGSGSSFAVRADGRLVVADAQLQRVQVLNADGGLVAEYALGAVPQSVAVGSDGRIVVATLDGGVLSVDVQVVELVPADSIGYPTSIALHPDGRVLVADGQANAIRAYSSTGREVGIQRLYLDDGRMAQPSRLYSGAQGVRVSVHPGEV